MNKEQNGDIVQRYIQIARQTWPVLVAIIGATWWLSGRLETPETKLRRIQTETRPIMDKLHHVEGELHELMGSFRQHHQLGGHAVMDARMNRVEDDIREIKAMVKALGNG